MTPREVYELSPEEYAALLTYAQEEARAAEREARKARRH